MSQWGAPRSPTSEGPPTPTKTKPPPSENTPPSVAARKQLNIDTATPQASATKLDQFAQNSPKSPTTTTSRARGDSRATRPNSMVQTYQPPQVEVANDTPPELQPIFSFLNSHSNKLYQEGYFLKLHDLDSRGRPSPDRVWNECFAQLVGTVLSLWDAAALDAAGEDGEVVPTFVNLSDAAIKMVRLSNRTYQGQANTLCQIESLPMNGAQGGSLQNVLSISTAANNRYLLHFNSLNSLTQWTAGIRLAMFEHSTLQEAYTGSLIAGKGRLLNNIKTIMERSKFAHEDWTRVRFGAGTPWKRCWCVIAPPDEKDFQKAQKTLKKTSAYERVRLPKGEIKFYDTRKVTKKTRPIATVTDAFAAYAIYPQSKPLIDQSTLVKLEGLVTVHGSPESTTEGFVFVMPEVHPAVSGFEMMLRWMFPVFDTFALYGRPSRLIADTLDQRGLMFAMPRDRRYGYLDILDVSALIHTDGSQAWSERQWRRELKKLTAARMTTQMEDSPRNSRQVSGRRNTTTSRTFSPPERASTGMAMGGVRFDDGVSTHSTPGSRSASPVQLAGADNGRLPMARRTDSAPPGANMSPHKRSVSDAQGYRKYATETPSRLSHEASRPYDGDAPPPPPKHGGALSGGVGRPYGPGSLERIQSGAEVPTLSSTFFDVQTQGAASPSLLPPAPVVSPPAFTHSPNSRPANQPYQAPELRRAHSNVDAATLYQMQDAARQREDTPEEEGAGWSGEMLYPQQNHVMTNTLANRSLGAPADRSQGVLNGAATPKQRDSRQRLSTIAGSPFVGSGTDGDHFQSPEQAYAPPQYDGAADMRPEDGLQRLQEGDESPPVPLHSSRSIARKPVPRKLDGSEMSIRSDSLPAERMQQEGEEPASPDSPASHGSWTGALIDQDALERILNSPGDRNNTMQSEKSFASSATPDYASTAPSEHSTKKSIERPRAGKLKTVGDPDYLPVDSLSGSAGKFDTWNQDQAEQSSSQMPNIDFGPTYAYKPKSRPGTSGTITPGMGGDGSRSRSADRLRESSGDRLSRISLAENNRHSYIGGRTTPSPGGMTPTMAGAADGGVPGDRRSIAWQPAPSSPVHTPGNRQSLTPEQWVQHRAAIASQPQLAPPRNPVPLYAHQRTASGNSVHQLRKSATKTPPPLSRTPSGDWTQYAPQQGTPPSRPQSRGANTYFGQPAQPSRPNSRGANAYLGQPSPGGTLYNAQPTNLSAREQMHVSRATGTPLISYTTSADQKQQEQQQPGLYGALAARQREKDDLKKSHGRESNSNAMVQQAIAQRQQQQMEADAQVQAQYQMQMQQQVHAQRMQYQAMLMAQGQQTPVNYGGDQQRPGLPSQESWQQQQYAGAPQGYMSPHMAGSWEDQQRAVMQQQNSHMPNGGSGQQWQQQQRRG
ncbi:hypothetical protein LTR85_006376 [Meristemomyces frigidus]|nr:hypothetical protein LTR85_006376 [Meristemomyces frigidus]